VLDFDISLRLHLCRLVSPRPRGASQTAEPLMSPSARGLVTDERVLQVKADALRSAAEKGKPSAVQLYHGTRTRRELADAVDVCVGEFFFLSLRVRGEFEESSRERERERERKTARVVGTGTYAG
jgi:hypothetical protein